MRGCQFRDALEGRYPQILQRFPPDGNRFASPTPSNALDPVVLGDKGKAQEAVEFGISESARSWSPVNPDGDWASEPLRWDVSLWSKGGKPLGRGLAILMKVP